MNDQWIDELRAEAVETEPRPGFREELRDLLDAEWDGRTTSPAHQPEHGRRWWVFGVAAASVAVLIMALVAITRGDDAEAPDLVPADAPVVPDTAEAPDGSVDAAPATTVTPAPTTSVIPAPTTTVAPAQSTSVPETTLPESTAPATVVPPSQRPVLLEGWPAGTDDPGLIQDVPTLLPTEPIPDAVRIVRDESVGGGLAFDDYEQTYFDTERNAWLSVRTILGAAPATAEEFRTAPIDTDGWANPWSEAFQVRSSETMASIELTAPGGLVRINALNVDDETVVELARTMQRRVGGEPGWDLDLPDGMQPFAESEAGPEARRSMVWFDADLPRAELTVDLENAEAVLVGWSEVAETDTIDLDGTPAVVAVEGALVTIAWASDEGAEIVFGYRGDRDTAERIARSIEPVEESTWIATGEADGDQDGCSSLYC